MMRRCVRKERLMKHRTTIIELIAFASLAFVGGHLIPARVRALPPEPSQSLAYGSVGIVDGQTVRVPAFPVEPVDTRVCAAERRPR